MELVNRVALIVRPKRRFLEWTNTLDGPHLTLDELPSLETVVLLVPLEPLDLPRVIDESAEEIFEQMLEGWHTDEPTWPTNRTPHVFRPRTTPHGARPLDARGSRASCRQGSGTC